MGSIRYIKFTQNETRTVLITQSCRLDLGLHSRRHSTRWAFGGVLQCGTVWCLRGRKKVLPLFSSRISRRSNYYRQRLVVNDIHSLHQTYVIITNVTINDWFIYVTINLKVRCVSWNHQNDSKPREIIVERWKHLWRVRNSCGKWNRCAKCETYKEGLKWLWSE